MNDETEAFPPSKKYIQKLNLVSSRYTTDKNYTHLRIEAIGM